MSNQNSPRPENRPEHRPTPLTEEKGLPPARQTPPMPTVTPPKQKSS